MSWFKSKPKVSEEELRSNSDYYPPILQRFIEVVKSYHDKFLIPFAKFGLPEPTLHTDWNTQLVRTERCDCGKRDCLTPSYNTLYIYSPVYSPPRYTGIQIGNCFGFFHSTAPNEIEKINALIGEDDYLTLFKKYKFRWFNHDPYAYAVRQFEPIVLAFAEGKVVPYLQDPETHIPHLIRKRAQYGACNPEDLQEVPAPELINGNNLIVGFRAKNFYNQLTAGSGLSTYHERIQYSAVGKNDLSPPTMDADSVYLKILPSYQEKPGIT